MVKSEEKKGSDLENRFQGRERPTEKQTAIKETDREKFDKSITDNGCKFTLGTAGEFQGFAYPAAIKIRSKDVKYDNEFKQYTLKTSYSTMARIIAWLKKPENKEIFNALLKEEKLKNEGTPELE